MECPFACMPAVIVYYNMFTNMICISDNRHGRRACLIGFGLIIISEMCGSFVMLNYSSEIFTRSGSSMSASAATIVMGAVQLLGACISTLLVDRIGRKVYTIFCEMKNQTVSERYISSCSSGRRSARPSD